MKYQLIDKHAMDETLYEDIEEKIEGWLKEWRAASGGTMKIDNAIAALGLFHEQADARGWTADVLDS